jgi:galactokinase
MGEKTNGPAAACRWGKWPTGAAPRAVFGQNLGVEHADRFQELTGHTPDGVWQAPGRVNLIGEHTDYNDGLALPFGIDRRTLAAVRRRADRHVRCWTTQERFPAEAELDRLQPDSVVHWARYAVGVLWAFEQAGIAVPGVDIVVDSNVPTGSGLSSSAALEAAVAVALDDLCRAGLDHVQLVELCHRAESEFVGAPVGTLDQFAVLCTRERHGLLIDFRSLDLEHLPLDVGPLVVVDTGIRHSNADGAYAARRQACAEAAAQLGAASLRDVTLADVAERLDGTLLRRARHVVTENDRVIETADRLRAGKDVGELLFASHASLRDDFEVSCAELDLVVETARDCGAAGARLTGAGFGGSAIVVGAEAQPLAAALKANFTRAGMVPPVAFTVVPSAGAGRLT